MKTRFTSLDLVAVLQDISQYCGLRVQNVYDVDSKTYLIKLQGPDQKAMLMFESGLRLHPTEFDWPKSNFPSSFSMKLRKHIKQKRLERVGQVGVDRIVDLQFGSGEWACHVIIELYDRGNVILTDHNYCVLNILRPRTDKDTDVKYAVREVYPIAQARQDSPKMCVENVRNIIQSSKLGENLKRAFVPKTLYGPALLEHCFRVNNIPVNGIIGKQITITDAEKIVESLELAETIMNQVVSHPSRGYLVVKEESKPRLESDSDNVLIESYEDFNPYRFTQMEHLNKSTTTNAISKYSIREFDSFGQAVDEFFSKKESQKIDLKALQQEKEAIKKLDNVKKDHQKRLATLKDSQAQDSRRAELIYLNEGLVEKAMLVIRSALANQMTWPAIQLLVDEGTANGDPTATAIKALNLESNTIKLRLCDPFAEDEFDSENEENGTDVCLMVDIDLALNPHQNARKCFVHKKQAFAKEQKTLAASQKAVKSAEQKTQKTLKDVQVRTTVSKHRKPFWFEKFFWFVSSDNYLVIGGRDAQQNELIVKRYLLGGDAYVHADLRGATSVVVKNAGSNDPNQIPPRTLSEAGTMAVAYSAAWEAKVMAGAWWVAQSQVSKTAPSGEYLTPGSFMIRGKKNYMAAPQLQMGFGFMFRMDDQCIQAHVIHRNKGIVVEEEEHVVIQEEQSGSGSGSDGEQYPDVQLEQEKDIQEDYTILQIGPTKQPSKPKHVQVIEEVVEVDTPVENCGPAKRGKRKKLKKIKEKYGEQDEEERHMRMQILGTLKPQAENHKAKKGKKKGGPKPTTTIASAQPPLSAKPETGKKEGEAKKKEEETEKREEVIGKREEILGNKQEIVREKEGDIGKNEEVIGNIEEVLGNKEEVIGNKEEVIGNKEELAGKMKEEEAGKDREEEPGKGEREEEAEDNEEDQNEVRDDAIQVLDSLTSAPFADDILLFAVPVCAPYSAMAQFKYKVKLTPGTGKKGKATKTSMQIFLKDKSGTQRERDLLNAAQDQQDIARNLPGKVKVSAPHILNVNKKVKK